MNTVLYEDAGFFIVNKSAGVDVATLSREYGGAFNVHRLDKDTSGVLLFAKSETARAELAAQFKARTVEKEYLVLVKGRLKPERGAIEAPIGRRFHDRKRMGIMPSDALGKTAFTSYEVVEYFDDVTLVAARPKTGRTHQIRVHFQSIGHPVVGDAVYGDRKLNKKFAQDCGLRRQFLHAQAVTFQLPRTNKKNTFTAPLPDDLTKTLHFLRNR